MVPVEMRYSAVELSARFPRHVRRRQSCEDLDSKQEINMITTRHRGSSSRCPRPQTTTVSKTTHAVDRETYVVTQISINHLKSPWQSPPKFSGQSGLRRLRTPKTRSVDGVRQTTSFQEAGTTRPEQSRASSLIANAATIGRLCNSTMLASAAMR